MYATVKIDQEIGLERKFYCKDALLLLEISTNILMVVKELSTDFC